MKLQTLQETLNEQKDIERLCRDRPLNTNEIIVLNAYYGIDHIIKTYAKLPHDYQLKVIIPHGMIYSDEFVNKYEMQALLPVVLYYPPFRQKGYKEKTDKFVFPGASPFLYAAQLLKDQPSVKRKGTLFFPAHSTRFITANMDYERLAEMLVRLDEQFQPVTVCIYWRDYVLGRHKPFAQRGLPLVSAGHVFDPHFLERLYHLLSIHHYAAGNSVGSHLFYALEAGCAYFHLDLGHSLQGDEAVLEVSGADHLNLGLQGEIQALFRKRLSVPNQQQLEMADFYLGATNLRTPLGLRLELMRAEILDRFGYSLRKENARFRIQDSTAFRRTGQTWRRPDRRLRRLAKKLLPGKE